MAPDVRALRSLPRVDLLTAGFPCTDLSQAGRTRGIGGAESGLVGEVFRLLRRRRVPVVVLENVKNMLMLDSGRAMRHLVDEFEALGYRWAYRVVDSRFAGVPQRRQRVIFVAMRKGDPSSVLFSDDAGPVDEQSLNDDLFGFYWTEGLRGLGWARDAVPTLKGGSRIGIPSPPGIWNRAAQAGHRLVTPSINDAERLQGFPTDWTAPGVDQTARKGVRWKLVGNAVSVGVSRWLGERLIAQGSSCLPSRPLPNGSRWPLAAYGTRGGVFEVEASMWPERIRYRHLSDVIGLDTAAPLSARAAAGFLERAKRGRLRFVPGFLEDVAEHVEYHRGARAVA